MEELLIALLLKGKQEQLRSLSSHGLTPEREILEKEVSLLQARYEETLEN